MRNFCIYFFKLPNCFSNNHTPSYRPQKRIASPSPGHPPQTQKQRDASLTMPERQIPNDHWATSNRGLNAGTIHKQLYTAQLERQRRSILSERFAWLRVWDQRAMRDGSEWRGLADGWLSLWYYRDSHLPNYWQASLITTIFPNRIRERAYQRLPSVSRSPHSPVDHLWKIRQCCCEWPI